MYVPIIQIQNNLVKLPLGNIREFCMMKTGPYWEEEGVCLVGWGLLFVSCQKNSIISNISNIYSIQFVIQDSMKAYNNLQNKSIH